MEYPVLDRGSQAGTVTLRPQGGRTQVEVSCRRDNSGLFRAYLLCQRGEYPLGVLEPKGEHMGLRRTVRTGELQALGAIWRGELRMSYAFSRQTVWQPLAEPETFFQKDPLLGRALAGAQGGLWRQEREGRQLALPYRADQPFPMAALFCFAQIQTIAGQAYAVYRFDGEENPIFP